MPLLLLILLIGVLAYMWVSRRGSTLTRACRWRLDRTLGPDSYRCAACGMTCDMPKGKTPRQCLRPSGEAPSPNPLPPGEEGFSDSGGQQ